MMGAGRSMYFADENTIYITPGSNVSTLGRNLFAENAHAHQFNNYPVSSRIRDRLDEVRLQIRSFQENKSRYEVQLDEYHTPGNIEYEAHEIIEPQLIKEAMEEERKLASE